MFKYTIKASNYDSTIGSVDIIQIVVTANNEAQAKVLAEKIAIRRDYVIIGIEDLKGLSLAKIKK